jgi:hypothetical protein
MTPAVAERIAAELQETLRERASDAAKCLATVSEDARQLTSRASEAIDDGVHSARRAMKTVRRDLIDARDNAVHSVKRAPVRSMAFAFGAGFAAAIVGAAAAWLVARRCTAA